MGYDTSFTGHFNVTPPLKKAHRDYLTAFAQVRHMQRDVACLENKKDPLRLAVHLHLGEEGAYFIGIPTPSRPHGDRSPTSILNHNKPPRGQPELHCQWIPSADGKQLVWDNGEKFYEYVAWLEYLVAHFLSPWGYQLNGEVSYQGQYQKDHGRVVAVQNKISIAPSKKKGSHRGKVGALDKLGVERLSREVIVSMLEATKGNQRTAAAQLGLNPSTLRGQMQHYNLRSEDFGPSAKPRKSAFRRERVVEVLSRTRGNQTQAAKLLGTSQSNFNHLIRQYQIAPSELQVEAVGKKTKKPKAGQKAQVGADPENMTPGLAQYRAEERGLPRLTGTPPDVAEGLVRRELSAQILDYLKANTEWGGKTKKQEKRYAELAQYRINEAEAGFQEVTEAVEWTRIYATSQAIPVIPGGNLRLALIWATQFPIANISYTFLTLVFTMAERFGDKWAKLTPIQATEASLAKYREAQVGQIHSKKSRVQANPKVAGLPPKQSCQIYSLSEDANEGDIAGRDYYEVCQEAEDLFHNASIRIMRDETLHEACISAEGEVMGASVIHVWDDSDRGMVLRFSVAVLEGARRQNIASRLVQSIMKEAKYMDVNVVEAWVVNPVMVTLLSKLGFEEPHGGWSQNNPFMEYTG